MSGESFVFKISNCMLILITILYEISPSLNTYENYFFVMCTIFYCHEFNQIFNSYLCQNDGSNGQHSFKFKDANKIYKTKKYKDLYYN